MALCQTWLCAEIKPGRTILPCASYTSAAAASAGRRAGGDSRDASIRADEEIPGEGFILAGLHREQQRVLDQHLAWLRDGVGAAAAGAAGAAAAEIAAVAALVMIGVAAGGGATGACDGEGAVGRA